MAKQGGDGPGASPADDRSKGGAASRAASGEAGGAGLRKAPDSFHHGNLPDALVAAASKLIEERASADFSLREVAEAVGVSHTAAYRHFRSKTDLMAEIALRGFKALEARLTASAEQLAGEVGDFRAAITQVGRDYIAFAVDNAGTYRTLFRPDVCNRSPFPDLANAADDAFLALVDVIATARRGGAITSPVADDVLASSFWASLHGYSSLLLDRQISEGSEVYAPTADRETFLDLLVTMLLGK